MNEKRFDQSPASDDTILFEVETGENPKSSLKVAIYHGKDPVFVSEEVTRVSQGVFQFRHGGLREGVYTLYWEWDGQNSQKTFNVEADRRPRTADPSRYVPRNKYKTLMNLYTPSMYKGKIKSSDLTPEVVGKLNAAVAEGFMLLEDLVSQMADAQDASLVHKSLLPYLANFFGIKLRTDETNRWRQQIKRAVQLNKRKGTLNGLYEGLAQAGIKLVKLTKLWQVTSQYFWADGFLIKDDGRVSTEIGRLSKNPLQIEKVSLRDSDGRFVNIPHECISVNKGVVTWAGESLNPPLHLLIDDVLIITYKTQKVPEGRRQAEEYLQTLPLADDRQDCSNKNWNVRLIEDDDPLFDLVAPSRHPFAMPNSYGKVRTQFLYSEQVYNMDAYNGSLRDSFQPCDLDDTFFDPCTACQSSFFNVDLEIENLSGDRIQEAREIIKEYSPFHARLHSMNVAGTVKEFILPLRENVECLMQSATREKVGQGESITCTVETRDGNKEKRKML